MVVSCNLESWRTKIHNRACLVPAIKEYLTSSIVAVLFGSDSSFILPRGDVKIFPLHTTRFFLVEMAHLFMMKLLFLLPSQILELQSLSALFEPEMHY